MTKSINIFDVKYGKLQYIDRGPIQFYVKEKGNNIYVDFIENPFHLVSEKLRLKIIKLQETIFFKVIVLADVKKMQQELYWLTIPETIECLSEKSEFNKMGELRKLVID